MLQVNTTSLIGKRFGTLTVLSYGILKKRADNKGAHWASHHDIPVKYFRPDWDKRGKAAGPIRNQEMAKYADVLLLIWDGKSKGSLSMRDAMEKLNKPIFEVRLSQWT